MPFIHALVGYFERVANVTESRDVKPPAFEHASLSANISCFRSALSATSNQSKDNKTCKHRGQVFEAEFLQIFDIIFYH
jgi:hypothetical protein